MSTEAATQQPPFISTSATVGWQARADSSGAETDPTRSLHYGVYVHVFVLGIQKCLGHDIALSGCCL